jgi:SPP1 gp7 family putative phage head morphogenesis protein
MPTNNDFDPTRLFTLRRRFVNEMTRRFDALAAAIRLLVIGENVFGITEPIGPMLVTTNTRWTFDQNPEKIRKFKAWLKEQVDTGILLSSDPKKPWTGEYVESAYKTAVNRTYSETHDKLGASLGMTAKEFAAEAFDNKSSVKQIKALYERSYTGLKGITKYMDKRISETLAKGFADGDGARKVAGALVRDVGISKNRALTLARTELTNAYAEGQLDGFEALGVEELGVLSEWLTAGDGRVCPLCASLNKSVYRIEDCRGLIPRHPNCRCSWIPNLDPKKMQDKRLTKTKKQIKESVGLERPRSSQAEANARSKWKGADLPQGAPKRPQTIMAPAVTLFNEQPTAIIRWMQQDGWSFEEIKHVLEVRGVEVAEGTIKTQISRAKKGQAGAELSLEQQNLLRGDKLKQVIVTTTAAPTTTKAPTTTPAPTTTSTPVVWTTPIPPTTIPPTTTPKPIIKPLVTVVVTTTPAPVIAKPSYNDVSKTGLIRQLAKEGYDFKEAKAFLQEQGIEVADGTIKKQLGDGRRGVGVDVNLSNEQLNYLRIRKGLPPVKPASVVPTTTASPAKKAIAKAVEKGSKEFSEPPEHITHNGSVTDLHRAIWKELDGKPLTDHNVARRIGQLVEDEVYQRNKQMMDKFKELETQVKEHERVRAEWIKKPPAERGEWPSNASVDVAGMRVELHQQRVEIETQIRTSRLQVIKGLRDFGDLEGAIPDRFKGDAKVDKRIQDQAQHLPYDWIADLDRSDTKYKTGTASRGYHTDPVKGYSFNEPGKLVISGYGEKDLNSTTLHELAHAMEYATDREKGGRVKESLGDIQLKFKEDRVANTKEPKNKELTTIYAGTTEMGYKDDFAEHYAGKAYPGRATQAHHELISMGIEDIVHGTHGMFKNDPDYRNFVVGMMVGF